MNGTNATIYMKDMSDSSHNTTAVVHVAMCIDTENNHLHAHHVLCQPVDGHLLLHVNL